jgi:hypothetical protein
MKPNEILYDSVDYVVQESVMRYCVHREISIKSQRNINLSRRTVVHEVG